jgi:hypothetical protein
MNLNLHLNNDNRNYYILGGIILVMVIIFTLRRCNRVQPVPPLRIETKVRDSIRTVVIVKDSIRTKYVHHWHTIRYDSLIPCEVKLAIADTVILIDSSEIASLKQLIGQDSIIISKLYDNIRKDTIVIRKLNKSLKRQKFITKIAFGAGAILGSIGTYKLTK